MYQIKFHKHVFKDLDKIPNEILEKINKALVELANNPFPWGFEKISTKQKAFRIRIGDWRVVYLVIPEERQIIIMRVRHRKDVYRNLPF